MTSSPVDALFRPLRVKSLDLPNRIVMAPMTRAFSPGGVPRDDVAAYYRRRAEGGVGLILSEGTVINRPAARNHPDIPFFHGHAALAGWQQVIDEVHAAGGRMGAQLWHVGSVANPGTDWAPGAAVESPSGLEAPGVPRGVAMDEQAIADTIAAFGRAAADAKRLGFDTVEIHGAHGYLLDQFLWSATNQRTDHYGGATVAERTRFAVEVVCSIRNAVGPDFPIILRLSQWKQQDYTTRLARTPDELSDWLVPLVDAGVDILHCSQRRFWEPEFPELDGPTGLNFAGWAKKLTGATTISVGSVGLSGDFLGAFAGEASQRTNLDDLVNRMDHDEFDLIAVGRALLSDPTWAAKVRAGDTARLRDFDPAAMSQLI
jgi:2,4-dienoyl-CoA reductase-like NADH-dependent reductase (Old Yellow Enzyme family)